MEELLNNLIKKGWKPFGWDDKLSSLHKEFGVGKWYIRFHNGMDSELFYLRELVSKESGLWQFVCENKLRNPIGWDYHWKQGLPEEMFDEENDYSCDSPEYRIIESALKDEEDLDKFLLDNIKIS